MINVFFRLIFNVKITNLSTHCKN